MRRTPKFPRATLTSVPQLSLRQSAFTVMDGGGVEEALKARGMTIDAGSVATKLHTIFQGGKHHTWVLVFSGCGRGTQVFAETRAGNIAAQVTRAETIKERIHRDSRPRHT